MGISIGQHFVEEMEPQGTRSGRVVGIRKAVEEVILAAVLMQRDRSIRANLKRAVLHIDTADLAGMMHRSAMCHTECHLPIDALHEGWFVQLLLRHTNALSALVYEVIIDLLVKHLPMRPRVEMHLLRCLRTRFIVEHGKVATDGTDDFTTHQFNGTFLPSRLLLLDEHANLYRQVFHLSRLCIEHDAVDTLFPLLALRGEDVEIGLDVLGQRVKDGVLLKFFHIT